MRLNIKRKKYLILMFQLNLNVAFAPLRYVHHRHQPYIFPHFPSNLHTHTNIHIHLRSSHNKNEPVHTRGLIRDFLWPESKKTCSNPVRARPKRKYLSEVRSFRGLGRAFVSGLRLRSLVHTHRRVLHMIS